MLHEEKIYTIPECDRRHFGQSINYGKLENFCGAILHIRKSRLIPTANLIITFLTNLTVSSRFLEYSRMLIVAVYSREKYNNTLSTCRKWSH